MHPAPHWCCPLPYWWKPWSHESAWTACWWAPWWRLQRALAMRWWCCWCRSSSNSWWLSSPPWLLMVWCADDLMVGLMVGLIIPWWSRAAGRSNKSFLMFNYVFSWWFPSLSPKESHGLPFGFQIFTHRNLMVYHRFSYLFPWESDGLPLIFLSFLIGISWFTIGFQIFTHRNLMVYY